jgi:hypothetical protein
MKMAGDWVEHRLTDADAPTDLDGPADLDRPANLDTPVKQTEQKNDRPSTEELRELRLRRFQ